MKTKSSQQLRFFADENIPLRLIRLLRGFDKACDITALEEVMAKGTHDEEWIAWAGAMKPEPAILCGDGRILKNPAQLGALKDVALHFLLLKSGFVNLSWNDLAWKTIKAWPEICKSVAKESDPTVFWININKTKPVESSRKLQDLQCRRKNEIKTPKKAQNRSA